LLIAHLLLNSVWPYPGAPGRPFHRYFAGAGLADHRPGLSGGKSAAFGQPLRGGGPPPGSLGADCPRCRGEGARGRCCY